MINGIQYGFQDIKLVLLGRPTSSLTKVSYTVKREKKNIITNSKKPHTRARGPESYEGSLGFTQAELEALQRVAGSNRKLTDIPMFDIVISYAQEDGGMVVTDVLKDCEFTETKKEMKAGDMNMEVELPIIIGDIQYNV